MCVCELSHIIHGLPYNNDGVRIQTMIHARYSLETNEKRHRFRYKAAKKTAKLFAIDGRAALCKRKHVHVHPLLLIEIYSHCCSRLLNPSRTETQWKKAQHSESKDCKFFFVSFPSKSKAKKKRFFYICLQTIKFIRQTRTVPESLEKITTKNCARI